MIKKVPDEKPTVVPSTVAAKVLESVQPIPTQLNWTIVLQGLFVLIATVSVAYFQMETAKAIREEGARTATLATKVERQLKTSTEASEKSLEKIVDTTASTHILINGGTGIQLQLTSDLSEWKANQTHDPVDIEAARLAKEKLESHKKQERKSEEDAKKSSGGALGSFNSTLAKAAYIRGLIEGQKEELSDAR